MSQNYMTVFSGRVSRVPKPHLGGRAGPCCAKEDGDEDEASNPRRVHSAGVVRGSDTPRRGREHAQSGLDAGTRRGPGR